MDDRRFPKSERLRRRREFLAVQRQGSKIHLQHLLAFVRANEGGRRVGFTVSSKVGNSVCRNRIKRVLRAVWCHCKQVLPEGMDIVLVAKRNAVEAHYDDLTREVRSLGRRLERRPERLPKGSRSGGGS